jgi:hypothetical protein
MKRLFFVSLFIIVTVSATFAIPPYFRVAIKSGNIETVALEYKNLIEANGFTYLGAYKPANNSGQYVIAFTSPQLKDLATGIADRGALGAVMKLGFIAKDGKIEVSVLNPEYIFNAYFRNEMEKTRTATDLAAINSKIINLFIEKGFKPIGFGGDLSAEELRKYHYMMGMPYFKDPVDLRTFSTFDEGVSVIRKNFEKNSGALIKVYELIDADRKVAVFGVGIPDSDKGEGHFLPIIGTDHIAAMPYEIILQGNSATMLHGRYRFASHWPELKMTTFTKIMSSPGDVEDFLKLLVK